VTRTFDDSPERTRAERLTEPLGAFLQDAIVTVERLDVLLLLRRHPDRYWDADAVGDRLDLRPDLAATSLEALAGHNLLDVRLTEAIRYRFAPATADQRIQVDRIAALWHSDRSLVVRELSGTRRSLADFSDAFRLGGREDDGG
jgi:hypothetical protein